MKNLSSYFKLLLLSIFNSVSFIFCFYLCIIFFLILMVEEEVKGRKNKILKEEFADIIQKFSNFPESFVPSVEKKEMDLSGWS